MCICSIKQSTPYSFLVLRMAQLRMVLLFSIYCPPPHFRDPARLPELNSVICITQEALPSPPVRFSQWEVAAGERKVGVREGSTGAPSSCSVAMGQQWPHIPTEVSDWVVHLQAPQVYLGCRDCFFQAKAGSWVLYHPSLIFNPALSFVKNWLNFLQSPMSVPSVSKQRKQTVFVFTN